jgi:RHS repeat-associated protein
VHGARTDEVVAQITPSNNWIRYFHYDANGNCTLQTDGWGNLVEQYDYDAFGFPYFYDASGNNIGYSPWGNRMLFTGREWLRDLKLYDYRNRLYNPELGRFMQPDPKEFAAGDYNLYRYCHNDPVNNVDPTGLGAWPPQFNEPIREFLADQWDKFLEDTKEMLQNPSSWVGPGEIGMAGAPERGIAGRLMTRLFPSLKIQGILSTMAEHRAGNFGLGSATRAQAEKTGLRWVGSNHRVASDGRTLISHDGLRQYRPPSFKPNLDKVQANFEQRPKPEGPWKKNGHLDITD